jgi:hypothetical protein
LHCGEEREEEKKNGGGEGKGERIKEGVGMDVSEWREGGKY